MLTELRDKLKSTQSNVVSLEAEISKGSSRIEELQAQLSDLNKTERNVEPSISKSPTQEVSQKFPLKQIAPQEFEKSFDVSGTSTSDSDTSIEEAESSNPNALIDWVLKKRTQ